MTKLMWSETFQDLWEVYDDLLGEEATLTRLTAVPSHRRAAAARTGHVVALGHDLGRLEPGPAQHRRRARARPAAVGGPGVFFALTDEQRGARRSAVRGYLRGAVRPRRRPRRSYEDPDGDGNPAELWKAAGEQGWLAVTVPEEFDGLGLGLLDGAGHRQGVGRGRRAGAMARAPCWRPKRSGSPGSTSRRRRGCPAWPPAPRSACARGRGAGAGLLPAVEYGAIADVVVAPTGLAGRRAPSTAPRGSYDGTVRLGRRHRLATVEELRRREPRGGAPRSAAGPRCSPPPTWSASPARRSPARSHYDKTREQFGVPVGSFQAIKHTLADLHVAVTMAEHAVLYAAHASTRTPTTRTLAVVGREGEGERRRAATRPAR